MKVIEQFLHVVLFITLFSVVLTFKSVDETLVCDHSNESYRVVHMNVLPRSTRNTDGEQRINYEV